MSPINLAVLLLVIGNLMASLSDIAVKIIDGGITPYQYIFLRQIITLGFIFPFWAKQSQAERAPAQGKLLLLRGHLILVGSGCMMVAVTHLPLATANAVFYAAPLLMLPLSIWILKETPPMGKVVATLVGFIGVLVVLRPSQFHWAAWFALGTATTLAVFNILVRKLPNDQTVTTTLFWTTLFSVPISLLLACFHWQPLSQQELFMVAASAICILAYNALAVAAYKKTEAGSVALAEYSGLVFVAVIGALIFDEIPDWISLLGILMIVIPLMPIRYGALLRQIRTQIIDKRN